VPVLEHDGRVLLQPAAILEYPSETFYRFGGNGTTRQHIQEWLRPPVPAALRLTIAEIACYADVAFARLSGRDLAKWPNVDAWAGRIEGIPAFAAPFDPL
jgi:glutathione S-transferase